MEYNNNISPIPQYSLGKTLLIWAAAIPMGILGWFVAPTLALNLEKRGFIRLAVLTVGLVWQFALVVFLLYRETGTLRWSTLRQHLWLTTPCSPQTGEAPRGSLWWWLVPVILLTALYEMLVGGIFDKLWVSMFPFFAEPQGFSLGTALDTPEAKSQLVGAWGIFWLFLLSALFNTFLESV